MNISPAQLQKILEAALMVSGRPLSLGDMQKLFSDEEEVTATDLKEALAQLSIPNEASGIELKELASGYQYQAKVDLSHWLARLWEERPPRYTRAVLETLALIAYRQPITRAEIEEVRGVAVSSNIIKSLQEREWIKVIGYRDVPGKPALYATTKNLLDHLNLKSLSELPALQEVMDLEAQAQKLQVQLELPTPKHNPAWDLDDAEETNATEDHSSETDTLHEDSLSKLETLDDEDTHLDENTETANTENSADTIEALDLSDYIDDEDSVSADEEE